MFDKKMKFLIEMEYEAMGAVMQKWVQRTSAPLMSAIWGIFWNTGIISIKIPRICKPHE